MAAEHEQTEYDSLLFSWAQEVGLRRAELFRLWKNVIRNGCEVVLQGMKVKYFSLQFASLTFLCLTFSIMSYAKPYTSVEQLKWKHRLIVAVQYQQPVDRATLATWVRERSCQLSERDVVFLLIEDKRAHELTRVGVALDTDSIKALINRSASDSQTSQFLLIGKDGGIKSRSEAKLEALDAFLARIDTMPMRRQEALNKGSGRSEPSCK